MSFLSLQASVIHETSQVSAGGQEEVGLVFWFCQGVIFPVVGSARKWEFHFLRTTTLSGGGGDVLVLDEKHPGRGG